MLNLTIFKLESNMAQTILVESDGSLERPVTYRHIDAINGTVLEELVHLVHTVPGYRYVIDLQDLVSEPEASQCRRRVRLHEADKHTFVHRFYSKADLAFSVFA